MMEKRQMRYPENLDPLSVTVPAALRLSGLGRTKLYELLAQKKIESLKVGTRRLVKFDSLQNFLSKGG